MPSQGFGVETPAASAAAPERPVLLRLEDVGYRYPAAGAAAVDGVSLDVRRGEFVSVVGPSGCGKSTLLALAAGLLGGYAGRISVGGDPITGPHPDVGVVFQEESTLPWRTARRNVEFGLEMRKLPKAERREKADAMLALVGLSDFAGYYPGQLSGGMKQRVAIARTLVTEPALLLMDEPFGALDEQTRLILGEELLRIQQTLHQTVLFITHNIQEAILLSDRVVLMASRPGRIRAVLDVPFPRPRGPEVITTPAFAGLVAEAWTSIRQEALQAMNRSPDNE